MRVLIGWDDDSEVELLTLYLEAAANTLEIVNDPDSLVDKFEHFEFDVVLMPLSLPDEEKALEAFEKMKEIDPAVPVLVAARPGEIYPLCRFIRQGLHTYCYRDPEGEYMFLLQTVLESALAGRKAEESRILAERLRDEVDSVRKLQESIIRKDLNAPAGYRVIARYEPSEIRVGDGSPIVLAGGDYYDAFRISEDKMILLVGDASGHGMKACMAIMSLHTLVNQLHENLSSTPDRFVAEINRRLCSEQLISGEGGFITLFFAILDREKLHWTSAGHCLPLLQNLETGEIVEIGDPKEDGGLPLAIYDDAEYHTISSPMPRNHRMLIYTDGLVEAFPGEDRHREFGVEGVCRTLNRCRDEPLEEALMALFKDSHDFTAGEGRHDDTSALLIERR